MNFIEENNRTMIRNLCQTNPNFVQCNAVRWGQLPIQYSRSTYPTLIQGLEHLMQSQKKQKSHAIPEKTNFMQSQKKQKSYAIPEKTGISCNPRKNESHAIPEKKNLMQSQKKRISCNPRKNRNLMQSPRVADLYPVVAWAEYCFYKLGIGIGIIYLSTKIHEQYLFRILWTIHLLIVYMVDGGTLLARGCFQSVPPKHFYQTVFGPW